MKNQRARVFYAVSKHRMRKVRGPAAKATLTVVQSNGLLALNADTTVAKA